MGRVHVCYAPVGDHPFIRDPRDPEPDECMNCGLPKAELEHEGRGEQFADGEEDE